MLAWCGMVCRDVVEKFDVNYGGMWNAMRCVSEMWYAAISDMVWCGMIEMQNVMWNMVWCEMWCPVMWKVTIWCEMWWCGIVVMKNVAYAMCGVIVVWCGKWCNVLWCQMWWCDVKSRCGGVMWCGIWCGMKCAVMLNVGVVWNSCGCGMVWDADSGCVMWNMSDVEYGGPRWDVLWH